MNTKTKHMIGLGALGTLLAITLTASACQTTGTLNEETIMKQSTMGSNSASGCPCTKEQKTEGCLVSGCQGSCGGEEPNEGCSEKACGGE